MKKRTEQGQSDHLIRVPLHQLHPHSSNSNVMTESRRRKLAAHIGREGRYPPLIVRPHPTIADAFEILDGHQRAAVLKDLGHTEALCFLWPCSDADALLLLATLNRLQGEDLSAKRAVLIADLEALMPAETLAALLPEDETQIAEALQLIDLDVDGLLAELTAAAEQRTRTGPRPIAFAVTADDEATIERAVARAIVDLPGRNKRGRALALICAQYLEDHNA